MVVYEFPFAFIPKERERATAKGGKAWLYSPASTKRFYTQTRTFLDNQYQDRDLIDYDCSITLVIGIMPINGDNDLDNRIKMIDALNPDKAKKKKSGFTGIWRDDSLIKKITAEIVYVETKEEEFTKLEILPHTIACR